MNVIVFASRKGGSGKSTLAVHLAAHATKRYRPCMLIDADTQGSVSLWHRLRGSAEPALRNGTRGVAEVVKKAGEDGFEWAFVDTAPSMSPIVVEAIRAATLVIIPARLAVFDLAAIKETIEVAREAKKPYAVVLNAAPPRRDTTEGAKELDAQSQAAAEIARLWLAIERSVKAIHGAYAGTNAMHRVAA